ncbi:MAG: hypothetical protein R3F03_14280 [Opitutaceae bacterium]
MSRMETNSPGSIATRYRDGITARLAAISATSSVRWVDVATCVRPTQICKMNDGLMTRPVSC